MTIPHQTQTVSWYPANTSRSAARFSLPFLVLGIIFAQKLSIAGEFFFGEIAALAYLALTARKTSFPKGTRSLIAAGFLWAFCQLISDQINETLHLDSFKGVGAPILFTLTLLGLYCLISRNIEKLPSLLIGIYLGNITDLFTYSYDYFSGNPWKWGISQMVIGVYSVYFTFFLKRTRNLQLITFISIFTVISLFNDSRSMAMLPIIAAISYLLLQSNRPNKALRFLNGKFAVAKFAAIIFTFLFVANSMLTAIFSSSWILNNLPEESAKKFQMQASGEYGILLGGRSELLISIEAFFDKPWFGHGSWAKDKNGYQDKLAWIKYNLGYSENDQSTYTLDLIPVHSHLMGALVWAGIGGGIFWILLISFILSYFIKTMNSLGFYFFNGMIALMWAIMFSPFGANSRWSAAVFVAAFMAYCILLNKKKLQR